MDISGYVGRPFSYDTVGILTGDPDPNSLAADAAAARFHVVDVGEVIGAGKAVFEEAGRRILEWEMHRRAGLTVHATTSVAALDSVVVLRLGPVPVPCRVLAVERSHTRIGFVYGTLIGHPESGEESFAVQFDPATDTVRARIRAVSRPGHPLVALGGPINRWAQSLITRRYVRALTSA